MPRSVSRRSITRLVVAASIVAAACSAPEEPHYGPPDGIVGIWPNDPAGDAGRGGDGGESPPVVTAACTDVASFTANAAPQLDQCTTCHVVPLMKPGIVDLTGLGKDDAKACASAKTRVNLADKNASKLLTMLKGDPRHPLTLTDQKLTDYETAIHAWIDKER